MGWDGLGWLGRDMDYMDWDILGLHHVVDLCAACLITFFCYSRFIFSYSGRGYSLPISFPLSIPAH